jgi:hypothetical protein
MTHQPKGGMCASCIRAMNDCSQLIFYAMPVIGIADKVKIVRCTSYQRKKDLKREPTNQSN